MCARAAFIIFASCVLLACAAPAPVPRDHFYRLPTHIETGNNHSLAFLAPRTISVKPFIAQGPYRDRAILYIDMSHPLQVNSYHYHYWLYSPSILLQDRFIDYLRARDNTMQIRRFTAGDRQNTVIEGRIVRFERLINAANSEVIVELELALRAHAKSTPDFLKSYRSRVAVDGNEMDAVVSAFGKAVDDTYRDFLSDIETMSR